MRVTLRFFATFREVVGQKELEREFEDAASVGEVLRELSREHPELEFYDDRGELREYLSVLRDGRDISFLSGDETNITDGDTISIFPPVAGGDGRVERTFRGISPRAAVRYLERVGGERVDEDTVVGDGWRAYITADEVAVGASLRLTEVTVAFEGDETVLEEVVEAFARKAMRAGG